MVDGLISVILPIYNVEKYLDRCIQSVVDQTYTKLEIILVDDGSPDNCPKMCDAWAKKDSRIKVIHKQNAGLGYARNSGLDASNGEYVCFIDSDDYVETDVIEKCYSTAKKHNAEIVCFGNDCISEKGKVLRERIPVPPQNTFAGNEVRERLLPRLISYDAVTGEDWKLSMSAWCEFISLKVIRSVNWRFVSEREIISEDFYSMFDLYQHINKVVILPNMFYHYTVNRESLSRSYRRDRYEKIRNFAISMQTLNAKTKSKAEVEICIMFLGLLMGTIRQIIASNECFREKLCILREIVNDNYLQNVLRSNDFSGDDLPKRFLYNALKHKRIYVCYFLAMARNIMGQNV